MMNDDMKRDPSNDTAVSDAANTREREGQGVTFISIHWSRLIAGGIFVLTGLLDFYYLGYAIGNHTGTGTAIFLGGPSFFWLIGMPILAIGGVLIIYFLVSPLKYTFKFDVQGSSFDANVKWLCLGWSYHISPVSRITYQRHRLGPKTIWIAILVPWIIWIVEYGAGLFDLPRIVSITLPTMMIFTAISDAAALAVLIFLMPSSLRVYSPSRVYEFWISCPPRNDVVERYFLDHLCPGCKPSQVERKTHCTRLVTGVSLCAGSLLGLFADVLFGEWFSMVGLVYGIVLVLEACFDDVNQECTDREFSQRETRYRLFNWRNPINYRLDIIQQRTEEVHQFNAVPPWHWVFLVYLLWSMALQLTFALRFGAISGAYSLVDYVASIGFASAIGYGFTKLVRGRRAVLSLVLPSVIAGLLFGLFL
jgi:hypothetical protein